MDISPILAEKIVHKLQGILPYTICVRSLSGELLCSSEQADFPRNRLSTLSPMTGNYADENASRLLMLSGTPIGKLVIIGSQDNDGSFSLTLDLAKELAESIIAEAFTNRSNDQKNLQRAVKTLLQNHTGIDRKKVQDILVRNDFDCKIPRTIIYFNLHTETEERNYQDEGPELSKSTLIYNSFTAYLRIKFSRRYDYVHPCTDHYGVFVFCEDRGKDISLSDIYLYNLCQQMVEEAPKNLWGDFRVVIGSRCVCFDDYSGIGFQMRKRLQSSLLLFPDEHVVFGCSTLLGNVVAFIKPPAKRTIINLVLGKLLNDHARDVYIETLRALFYHNLNMNEVANSLHIHRNTLQYRLKKIESLTGHSIYKIDEALTIRLALLCYEYLSQFNEGCIN